MREGGRSCLKYLKNGWNRKEGKKYKKGGPNWFKRWIPKKEEGVEPPYKLCGAESACCGCAISAVLFTKTMAGSSVSFTVLSFSLAELSAPWQS